MTPSGAGHSISEFLARKVTHADQQALGPAGSDEPKIERWTAQRKAAIVLDVLKVKISVPEACRKYGFPQGEFREWAEDYHRAGVDTLKINRKGLEAEYRAEIKRLRAKIGE